MYRNTLVVLLKYQRRMDFTIIVADILGKSLETKLFQNAGACVIPKSLLR